MPAISLDVPNKVSFTMNGQEYIVTMPSVAVIQRDWLPMQRAVDEANEAMKRASTPEERKVAHDGLIEATIGYVSTIAPCFPKDMVRGLSMAQLVVISEEVNKAVSGKAAASHGAPTK